MRVNVIKLGARISFGSNDTSGGNGEARSIIKILETAGADIHIYTKIIPSKDRLIKGYNWHQIGEDVPTEGVLLVINGSVNFFGGQEDKEQIRNYHFINHFKGKVFYAYCDPYLPLGQVWPSIEKKAWKDNWNEHDIKITRDDIVYIAQPYDLSELQKTIDKKADPLPGKVVHFPFEQFPCLTNPVYDYNPNPSVDLSYGGGIRGGRRNKKLIKFYFDHPEDLSVEIFGKIRKEDFSEKQLTGITRFPQFTAPVQYDKMDSKMNDALAHVVIGDPLYEDINDVAQRTYEAIQSRTVTFIDADLDKMKKVYGNHPVLSDFLYVSSREELYKKIVFLKTFPVKREQITQQQLKAVGFSPIAYSNQLIEILKG